MCICACEFNFVVFVYKFLYFCIFAAFCWLQKCVSCFAKYSVNNAYMYTFKSRVLQIGFQQFRFELYTRLRFETEVKGNLEMAYLCVLNVRCTCYAYFKCYYNSFCKQLYVSQDFGFSWRLKDEHVRTYYW